MRVHRELIKLILAHRLRLIFGVIAMVTFAIFAVAPAKFMKDIIDALGSGKVPSLNQFIYVALGIILLYFLKGIAFYFQSYLMGSLGLILVKELRARLFQKIIHLPLSFFNRKKTGDLISSFTTDLNILNEAITMGISGPVRDLPQIALLLYLMFDRSWQLAIITLALIPMSGLVINKFGKKSKKFTSKRLQQYSNLTSLLNEVVMGIRVVKAFRMEAYAQARFQKENKRLYRYFVNSVRVEAYSYPILELIGGVFAAVILTYGGYLVIHGQMTGGDFASFIMAFFMLYDPIKKFNGFALKIQEGVAASHRIFGVLKSELKIQNKEGALPLKCLEEAIHIKLNRFKYDETEVLHNIDIKVKKGEIIALVGSSGSGKSTLVNLIPRFYEIPPEDGQILIDGVDIADATLESLRSQIAVVTQEVVLFDNTVKSNIIYGDPDSDDNQEKIEQAAKAGNAHEFIIRLPEEYEEEIGISGGNLSGGQKQRLSISRALIKNSSILILDEATSALDNESEQEVQQAIENLMVNRTTFVIAHRLSTILNADRIYVMKKGNIVEQGKHEELLLADGEYKKLFESQFQDEILND